MPKETEVNKTLRLIKELYGDKIIEFDKIDEIRKILIDARQDGFRAGLARGEFNTAHAEGKKDMEVKMRKDNYVRPRGNLMVQQKYELIDKYIDYVSLDQIEELFYHPYTPRNLEAKHKSD